MKDKLRELAGDWRVSADAHDEICFGAAADVGRTCADELLAILDAEGDGGTPLPGVVWNERTNAAHLIKRGTEVEFCAEYGCCRVFTHTARSGAVRDEDVERVIASMSHVNTDGMDGDSWDRILVRAALEHFAKSSGEAVRDAPELFAGTKDALSNLSIHKSYQEKTS